MREQPVGVKRFSLAGTTVSLCKIKEMGVHIPRGLLAALCFPQKEPGAHIPRDAVSPGGSHGRLPFKGVSPNCGFTKTSHYSQKEVKI